MSKMDACFQQLLHRNNAHVLTSVWLIFRTLCHEISHMLCQFQAVIKYDSLPDMSHHPAFSDSYPQAPPPNQHACLLSQQSHYNTNPLDLQEDYLFFRKIFSHLL